MLKIHINSPNNCGIIYVDMEAIFNQTQDEIGYNYNNQLKNLATSIDKERVVFRTNRIDNDGIMFSVLRGWLKQTRLSHVMIETSSQTIKDQLLELFHEQVRFKEKVTAYPPKKN